MSQGISTGGLAAGLAARRECVSGHVAEQSYWLPRRSRSQPRAGIRALPKPGGQRATALSTLTRGHCHARIRN